jgi:hypothetical protein
MQTAAYDSQNALPLRELGGSDVEGEFSESDVEETTVFRRLWDDTECSEADDGEADTTVSVEDAAIERVVTVVRVGTEDMVGIGSKSCAFYSSTHPV